MQSMIMTCPHSSGTTSRERFWGVEHSKRNYEYLCWHADAANCEATA